MAARASVRGMGTNKSLRARVKELAVAGLFSLGAVGPAACEADLGERAPQNGGSFGAIVFREACQRVTYSAELATPGHPVDVSGQSSRTLCLSDAKPGDDADPAVRALFSQRENIVTGVNSGVPDQPDDLQSALDGYLRAVQPLQDDGTLVMLIERVATVLTKMAADDGVVKGLERLGHVDGIRPASSAGGLLRAIAGAQGLDDFIGASLPILDTGGAGAAELATLLRASAFELGHLEPSSEAPNSPERTPWLLRQLLTTTHPELVSLPSLLVTLRDSRGLPLLREIVDPYVPDLATGLALADANGYFRNSLGQRLPYLPPLLAPGGTDAGSRDGLGRALWNRKVLYQYVDLDGSLLLAALADANRLLDDRPATSGGPPRDMLFGMLEGASLLAGGRIKTSKSREGDTLPYLGFDPVDSTLLDVLHAGLQLLRFAPQTAGQDLSDLLSGVRTLLDNPANQSPLARAARALLDAADEAKLPAYDAAKLPADATLYDDLAPIITRLLAVDDGQLAEDLVIALSNDHAKNLGPIMAQLADERGYFFMRQINSTEGLGNLPTPCAPKAMEDLNGLTPCGVIGEFGNKPDRSAPDSDTTLGWRNKKTSDPQNNRSVLQRLLHMVADSNGGRPFCNGRNASVFGGLVRFENECDMFQVDNVARFFLLTMATPTLRERTDTWAKQAASFREAIKNGRLCRGATPDPSGKCAGLLTTIDDGNNGDLVLEGMMGIVGFGRYPDAQPASRAIFTDVADPPGGAPLSGAPKRTQDLVFNHVPMASGFIVDPADPDNRKFRDGAGVDHLFIDEHNGVLFALEKIRGPAVFADGTPNRYPNDTFYDAMRPLVDAFAKHAECVARDTLGTCTKSQNATQILADAMTVLHRHYPSGRSQYLMRGFAESYGPAVQPDGAVSYEPLLAKVLCGDLLLASAALAPILSSLTVDGMAGSRRVLPILVKAGRFVFDSTSAPGLRYRDDRQIALRNDGQPAGPATVFYMLADALKKKRQIFEQPENHAAKARWDRARSDIVDVLLKVNVTPDPMGGAAKTYAFEDQRLRPFGTIVLGFLIDRVKAHKSDLGGWADKLDSDGKDALSGPLLPALLDLGTKLSADEKARQATYALLRQLLDPSNTAARDALAVAVVDGVQLLLDEPDLIPIGRGVASALHPDSGPALTGVTLMRRGRELELASELIPAPSQGPKSVLVRLLSKLYQLDGSGLHPMSRLTDAIAEVNRQHRSAELEADFTADDYRSVLTTTANFLIEEQRGLKRFLNIVRSRCLPEGQGAMKAGCSPAK